MSGNPSKMSLFEKLCGVGGAKKNSDSCSNKCEDNNNSRCPPMPCFNTGDCKPSWLCTPDQIKTKTYPVPPGVNIIPISKGRNGGGSSGGSGSCDKCSACGQCNNDEKPKAPAPPKVTNKDCPMMKARCPNGKAPPPEKKESGLFAKITSFFGKKKSE